MNLFGGRYAGRRVLVTGHTGFKGSWLCLWLRALGAEVTGLALAPDTDPNHWGLLNLRIQDHRVDLRDGESVRQVVEDTDPEVVFHLGAQSLVRRSYREPLETWSSNVVGTATLLDALRASTSLRAVVVVTSDKCYENREWPWGYRELDRLGGHDPYSASKAATELVVSSFRDSFFEGEGKPLLASARAGNVIGGGDWAEDRLIPDVARSVAGAEPVKIRNPEATRPWQHVLESLSGYLLLGQGLLEGRSELAGGWNFGPAPEGNRTVSDVLERFSRVWAEVSWQVERKQEFGEAKLLFLDSTKASTELGWAPVWTLDQAVEATAQWYREFVRSGEVSSEVQLRQYVDEAVSRGANWSGA